MVPSPIAAHLHDAAWRPRHRPAHEQEVVLGDDLDDLEAALGHAAAAHAARPADALEHARRRGRRADRAGLADVVRAVALGAGGEVVALDRALEALALRGPPPRRGTRPAAAAVAPRPCAGARARAWTASSRARRRTRVGPRRTRRERRCGC